MRLSSRAETRTDTRTVPRDALMSMNPLGIPELGLASVLVDVTDGVGPPMGFAKFTVPDAAGSTDFGLRLTVAVFGAGGTCESLTPGGGNWPSASECSNDAATGNADRDLFGGNGGGPPDDAEGGCGAPLAAGMADGFPGAVEPGRADGASGGCFAGG
jgi:hypothetical protein